MKPPPKVTMVLYGGPRDGERIDLEDGAEQFRIPDGSGGCYDYIKVDDRPVLFYGELRLPPAPSR